MDRKYYLFDAQGKTIGRFATQIAKVLSGKNKIEYLPNVDGGDYAIIINSDEIKATGRKMKGKIYNRFSGYPGGITAVSLETQLAKDSRKVIWNAIYGMLPKNKLRKKMLGRLFIYKNATHNKHIDIKC